MYGWSRIVREMKKVDRGPERLGLQQKKKERWLLQKDKQSLDLQESRVIKDQDGNVLTIEESRYLSAAPFRGRHSASSAFISVYPKHPSPFCVTCCVSILVTSNEKVSILTSSTQTHIHLCFIGKCKWDCFFQTGLLVASGPGPSSSWRLSRVAGSALRKIRLHLARSKASSGATLTIFMSATRLLATGLKPHC